MEEIQQPIEQVAAQQPAAQNQEKKEDSVKVPTSIIRWVFYINYFLVLLLPAFIWGPLTVGLYLSAAFILAQFAGQLNKLISIWER